MENADVALSTDFAQRFALLVWCPAVDKARRRDVREYTRAMREVWIKRKFSPSALLAEVLYPATAASRNVVRLLPEAILVHRNSPRLYLPLWGSGGRVVRHVPLGGRGKPRRERPRAPRRMERGKVPLSSWPAAVTTSGVGTGHARRHRRIEVMRDEAILRNGELKNRVYGSEAGSPLVVTISKTVRRCELSMSQHCDHSQSQ